MSAELKRQLREEIRAIDDKVKALGAKREPLAAALAALSASTVTEAKCKREFKGRKSREQHAAEVGELLRAHPDEQFSAGKVRERLGTPHSSAQVALADLLEAGRATRVAETSRGGPIVKYRATKVRPGEEVSG